jgi:hypothetical protein
MLPSESGYTLGPERRQPLPGCPGLYVRIRDDLRKCVVFFGHVDDTPGKGGINCIGTGFLVAYEEAGYLVRPNIWPISLAPIRSCFG